MFSLIQWHNIPSHKCYKMASLVNNFFLVNEFKLQTGRDVYGTKCETTVNLTCKVHKEKLISHYLYQYNWRKWMLCTMQIKLSNQSVANADCFSCKISSHFITHITCCWVRTCMVLLIVHTHGPVIQIVANYRACWLLACWGKQPSTHRRRTCRPTG